MGIIYDCSIKNMWNTVSFIYNICPRLYDALWMLELNEVAISDNMQISFHIFNFDNFTIGLMHFKMGEGEEFKVFLLDVETDIYMEACQAGEQYFVDVIGLDIFQPIIYTTIIWLRIRA
ncbi:hypothetical protein ACJX0J_029025, partial [Zea mays]